VSFVALAIFLLLDDLLKLFLALGLLDVLHGVLDLKFKLCAFCCQCTHQGGDKPSGQFLGLIVMSH
jgi:hypothetical protein